MRNFNYPQPVEDWSRAPLSLRGYIALNIVGDVVVPILRSPIALIGLPITLLWAYFLLRQNRIAWLLAVAAQLLALPLYITGHQPWIYFVWIGLDLVLLLAPETRRFFSHGIQKALDASSSSPGSASRSGES